MANELTFKISGVAEAVGEMRQAIQLGERNGMEKLGLLGEQLVKQRTPVGATANLISGVFSRVSEDGPQLSAIVSVQGPAASYATPVDLGAKPHMPAVEPIILWVQKKLHVNNEKQATSIAWAIAMTIKKRGMKGANMFEEAYDHLASAAPGVIEREIAEAVQAAGFKGAA